MRCMHLRTLAAALVIAARAPAITTPLGERRVSLTTMRTERSAPELRQRARQAGQPPAAQSARDIGVLELASLRRMFDAVARQRDSADEAERVAAWSEFSL